jgi:hypothetical protein
MGLRIRIRTKMSWIRKTGFFSRFLFSIFYFYFLKITCLSETGPDLKIAVPARQADQRDVRQPTRPLSRPVAAHLLTTQPQLLQKGFMTRGFGGSASFCSQQPHLLQKVS